MLQTIKINPDKNFIYILIYLFKSQHIFLGHPVNLKSKAFLFLLGFPCPKSRQGLDFGSFLSVKQVLGPRVLEPEVIRVILVTCIEVTTERAITWSHLVGAQPTLRFKGLCCQFTVMEFGGPKLPNQVQIFHPQGQNLFE